MRRPVALLWLLLVLSAASGVGAGAPVTPPRAEGSIRFAVIGDSGSGAKVQYQLAERLIAARQTFPYTFVLMMGDNIYGNDSPKGFAKKFEIPYKPLLDASVPFYATLGNHDAQDQRFYKGFNMGGHRYYTFTEGSVQFFVMDTTYMDRGQLEWLDAVTAGIAGAVEDCLRTPSLLLHGEEAWLRSGPAAAGRAAVHQIRRQRRLRGTRAFLRADRPSTRHCLLHLRRRG